MSPSLPWALPKAKREGGNKEGFNQRLSAFIRG